MVTLQEIEARLTGPGAPFEIALEDVLGERLPVFKSRKRSLRELVAEAASRGDREYIVHGDRRISYAETAALVASTAAALRQRFGVGPGDRVAILAENRPEWILCFLASVCSDAVVAAMNGWWTGDEIRHGIELAEPTVLVGDRKRLARISGDPGVPVLEIESEGPALLSHSPAAAPICCPPPAARHASRILPRTARSRRRPSSTSRGSTPARS